jgi:hypothetical protein
MSHVALEVGMKQALVGSRLVRNKIQHLETAHYNQFANLDHVEA